MTEKLLRTSLGAVVRAGPLRGHCMGATDAGGRR